VLPERSEPRPDIRIAAVGSGQGEARDAAVTITRGDSEVIATAMSARLADPRAEAEREAVLCEVIHAARDLQQGMRDQTLHALAEYRGSHSTWNVVADAGTVYAALDRYSVTMRGAAARLRQLLAR
jgi:hypothetical protein